MLETRTIYGIRTVFYSCSNKKAGTGRGVPPRRALRERRGSVAMDHPWIINGFIIREDGCRRHRCPTERAGLWFRRMFSAFTRLQRKSVACTVGRGCVKR
jgi:hypothetical protein